MAAPNGMQPSGGAPYGLGSAIMPSAGHHHDMQHVWSLVEELSGILNQNRERWEELQTGIARAQIRPHEATNGQNGEEGAANGRPSEPTVAELQIKLAEAERKIAAMETAYQEQGQLVTAYENGMHETAERLRNHVYEQTQATNAIHAHYLALLSAAQEETLQAQLTHQAWQASLARLSEGVRRAYAEKSEFALPYERRIAALKAENRLLRRRVGWEPEAETSDEEEEEEEEEEEDGGIPPPPSSSSSSQLPPRP